MNVKIKEQSLRFKISKEELSTLLDGHPVHAKVSLLNKTLVVSINPAGSGETMEPKLILDERDAYLNLLVPSAQVQALKDIGQSRDGISQEADGTSVTLQVDMRNACHT